MLDNVSFVKSTCIIRQVFIQTVSYESTDAVIEGSGVDHHELVEVVLVGRVITVPGYYVEAGVALACFKKTVLKKKTRAYQYNSIFSLVGTSFQTVSSPAISHWKLVHKPDTW